MFLGPGRSGGSPGGPGRAWQPGPVPFAQQSSQGALGQLQPWVLINSMGMGMCHGHALALLGQGMMNMGD